MGNLEQAIHDQNTVKQGVNFTDADKAKLMRIQML
ncbi:surface protein, ECM binding protein-like protein A [Staphylococcus aureus]|uniref:Surface protein, ECM binding protein-like protein A n=1 Tax=Staphylococcus aureus TaxID=1280 RepID=A0A380E1D7_STAAU|nr:surface protein, ECM binding protein-like protein A [Staphylococcus aureus]